MFVRCTGTPSRPAGSRGFTLVEIMLVVAIIAILIAVLLPSLGKARESARRVVCLSNLNQAGQAFLLYLADSRGRFPFTAREFDPQNADWLWWQPGRANDIGGVGPYLKLQPGNFKGLLCPSDDVATHVPSSHYPASYTLNEFLTTDKTSDAVPYGAIATDLQMVVNPPNTVLLIEESERTVDDGQGYIWQPPGMYQNTNLLAVRHDKSALTMPEPAGYGMASPFPNPTARGTVSFVDAHTEFVPRNYVHTIAHSYPEPSVAPSFGYTAADDPH